MPTTSCSGVTPCFPDGGDGVAWRAVFVLLAFLFTAGLAVSATPFPLPQDRESGLTNQQLQEQRQCRAEYQPQMQEFKAMVVAQLVVPDVKGLTKEQAEEKFRGKHLLLKSVENDRPGWLVAQQYPLAGREVAPCSWIDLSMQGPPSDRPEPQTHLTKVPDITQWPEDLIPLRLNFVHLVYLGSSPRETSAAKPGVLFDQSPRPDSPPVPWGTRVTAFRAVSPVPPPAELNIQLRATPEVVQPGDFVSFEATGVPPQQPASYQFIFGDGQSSPLSDEPSIQHRYLSDGDYSASVTVLASDRQSQSPPQTIIVHNVTYTVTLTATPESPRAGQIVSFEARVWPPPPSDPPPQFRFDFGHQFKSQFSEFPTATHTFDRAQTYPVRVFFRTADKHEIASQPIDVTVVIPPPPPPPAIWKYVSWTAAAALFGTLVFAGWHGIQRRITARVSLLPIAGDGDVSAPLGAPDLVEAAFGFRVIQPQPDAVAHFRLPAITRIERRA